MKRIALKFPTPTAEADAIDAMLAKDLTRILKTCDPLRLAAFKTDALKRAEELRLLAYSQSYSRKKI